MKKRLGLLVMVLLALGVTACNNTTSSAVDGAVAKLQQAYEGLGALISDPTNITAGFEVPATLANGVTAEWSSDEPGVISFGTPANGFIVATVNRPAKDAGDAAVTISALLSLQSEITSEMLHQTWSLDVIVKQNTVAELTIDNIDDVLAIVDPAYDGTLSVTLNDMTIFAKSAGEAFAYDGTGIIQVFAGAASTMLVGHVYTVAGTAEWYFGIWEITKSTATEQTSATPQYPSKEIVTSVSEKITALATAGEQNYGVGTSTAANGNFEPIYATVTGKIYMIPADTSNYNTWIMDTTATEYVAGIAKTDLVPETPSNSLMVYYNTSDFNLVKQYAGIVVTLDVVIYTYRSNNHGFAVYYVGGPTGIEATLTDEQKLTIDANSISLPSSVTEATTLSLPVVGTNGSAIAWASSSPTTIDPVTGVVTIPTVGILVTMTATVTYGSLTAIVKTFTVVVGPLENTTMAAMLTKLDGDVLYSEAEVLWIATNGKSAVVGDSTGYGYIYNSVALTLTVGSFYGFNYTVDVYSNLYEMTNITVLTAKGTDPNLTPTAATWTATEALAFAGAGVPWAPSYVAMEVIGYASGSYTNAYLLGFGTRYVQTNGATAEFANKKFTATGWIIGLSSSKLTIQGTYTNPVDATDAEKLAVSVGMFRAPAGNAAVTANLSLPTAVTFGSIAWTSSNAAVITDAGVVTRPAAGQPDAAVTMSYVITVGLVSSESVAIEYTVKAEEEIIPVVTPDLFISEYIEGTSNNKAIEIYNPTGAAVDLSGYSISQYGNGASTTTTTSILSGTLAAGEVYVLANASANATILAQADYFPAYSTTVFSCGYNGDDAIALYKGTTLIDLIGVIGTDPGTNWVVGTGATSEYTLVRDPSVHVGNTAFTPTEWIVNPQDTFTFLGSHTVTA